MRLFGFPLFGVILPYIGRATIPLNRDGSLVNTGADDLHDEVGPYYTRPFVFEWLGFGTGLAPSPVYDSRTHEPVDPPWLAAEA